MSSHGVKTIRQEEVSKGSTEGAAQRDAKRRRRSLLKGLLAGLAGGVAASLAMNRLLAITGRAFHFEAARGPLSVRSDSWRRGQGGQLGSEDGLGHEPPTVRAAETISQAVFGHRLTEEEKGPAGQAVHYAFGATTGMLYGALSERFAALTRGFGLPYGLVVWIAADELALPALGLGKSPRQQRLPVHLYALSAHLLYGAMLEGTRRVVRRML